MDVAHRLQPGAGRTGLKASLLAAFVLSGLGSLATLSAHDVTTNVTWNREIVRIVTGRCASCHRPGGDAFPLLTYQEANPWARAIKDQVLRRQMPPWGAVRGFGAFRNEEALSQEEIDLVRNWVDGGAPEGNPDHLPPRLVIPDRPVVAHHAGELAVTRDEVLPQAFTLDGVWVRRRPVSGQAQITLVFPDGRIEPLLWLHNDRRVPEQPFLLRRPLSLPAGTAIRGLAGATLLLMPPAGDR